MASDALDKWIEGRARDTCIYARDVLRSMRPLIEAARAGALCSDGNQKSGVYPAHMCVVCARRITTALRELGLGDE